MKRERRYPEWLTSGQLEDLRSEDLDRRRAIRNERKRSKRLRDRRLAETPEQADEIERLYQSQLARVDSTMRENESRRARLIRELAPDEVS